MNQILVTLVTSCVGENLFATFAWDLLISFMMLIFMMLNLMTLILMMLSFMTLIFMMFGNMFLQSLAIKEILLAFGAIHSDQFRGGDFYPRHIQTEFLSQSVV